MDYKHFGISCDMDSPFLAFAFSEQSGISILVDRSLTVTSVSECMVNLATQNIQRCRHLFNVFPMCNWNLMLPHCCQGHGPIMNVSVVCNGKTCSINRNLSYFCISSADNESSCCSY